jgi:hypothetical protein
MKNETKEKMWTFPCEKCGFVLGIENKNIDEVAAGVWGTINCPNCGGYMNPIIQKTYYNSNK